MDGIILIIKPVQGRTYIRVQTKPVQETARDSNRELICDPGGQSSGRRDCITEDIAADSFQKASNMALRNELK